MDSKAGFVGDGVVGGGLRDSLEIIQLLRGVKDFDSGERGQPFTNPRLVLMISLPHIDFA